MCRPIIVAFLLGVATPAFAQSEPTVTVLGKGEVALVPDFATLSIGVRVQEATPDAAATAMSAKIEEVVDTLISLGVPRDSLPTRVFGISTDRAREEGNRIIGYTSQVTLELRTFELDRLAEFVGAAIAKGATDVGQVQWLSTQAEVGRREALRLAVLSAQADAEVIADARSVRLGDLIDISVEGAVNPRSAGQARRRSQIEMLPAPVSRSALMPQVIVVTESVIGIWRLAS
jgi:uncharacterized protein